jgi:hypothetical protein
LRSIAGGFSPAERLVLGFAATAAVLLRAMYILNHEADSDEPQHLHVVWEWTRGLVQYRDVFDNHAPLFHLVMTPWIGWVGAREDILVAARLLMVPLVAVTLWATYRLGRDLASPRVGVWAAVVTALAPGFLLTSTEFRADVLWMAAWLCALAVLLGGAMTPRRSLFGGLLLGAALATSLKSVLLFQALAIAAVAAHALCRVQRSSDAPRRLGRALLAMSAGLLIVPATIVILMWRLHALPALLYCTVQHNVLPGLGAWRGAPVRMLVFPLALALLLAVARRVFGAGPPTAARRRGIVLLLTTGLYLGLLEGFWPLITREDFLPSTPMLAVLGVAAASALGALLTRRRGLARAPWRLAAAAAVITIEVARVNMIEPAWIDHDQAETRLLHDVLRATRVDEDVVDLKGETVFRTRSDYFVLEGITKARVERGLIPDRIALDVERTRTHFAVPDNICFPPSARAFLNEHFVTIGGLRVLGADLDDTDDHSALDRAFDVSFPERFAVVADGHPARGRLDGAPFAEALLLAPGRHTYVSAPGERHVEVVWADAIERGLVESTVTQAAR